MFVIVGSGRNAVERDLAGRSEIAVAIHLPVSRRINRDISEGTGDLKTAEIFHRSHGFRNLQIVDVIIADLTIAHSSADMIGSSSNEHLSPRRHVQHFIILTVKRKELSRKIFLENMSAQFRAEEMDLILFVFCDTVRILQLCHKQTDEIGIIDIVQSLDLPGIDVIADK